MIWLTRLNRMPLVLNCDLIEHIEITPDTVITLTNGQIVRVRETAEEVINRIVDFRRRIYLPEALPAGAAEGATAPAQPMAEEGISGLH